MKRNTYFGLPLLSAVMLSAGCISQNTVHDPLSLSVKQQADAINSQLPINEEGVVLVRAVASEHQMTLRFYQSDASQGVNKIMQRYGDSLCQQPDVKGRIKQGARYNLEGTDASGAIHQRMIDSC